MNLTAKQIALFGQVRVNVLSIGSNLVSYTTLLELYKSGWWITERFGTNIMIVRQRAKYKDGFSCLIKRIVPDPDVNLDALDEQIKIIADRQYEKYKYRLDENRVKYRHLKKVNIYEN
jgi:hypothetical protein